MAVRCGVEGLRELVVRHRAVQAVSIESDATLIDRVADATSFGEMQANAAHDAPVAGTGFWEANADFFDFGRSRNWERALSDEEALRYETRIDALLPDDRSRTWLEIGDAVATGGKF